MILRDRDRTASGPILFANRMGVRLVGTKFTVGTLMTLHDRDRTASGPILFANIMGVRLVGTNTFHLLFQTFELYKLTGRKTRMAESKTDRDSP